MTRELDILIVEDVPQDADAIENELRSESISFSARRLQSKEEFIAELQKSVPDIILSDFTLPEFNALEALRLLQERGYDVPFILVTGTRSEEVAVECIKEGADDYILKASLKRLPSSLINVLKKKAAEREKSRAEEALRRSEEQYRLITENTRDLISLLDPEGRFIYASPSFRHGLGYLAEELAGADCAALVSADDQSALRQSWQDARARRESHSAEFRVRHRDGRWRTFEAVTTWIFDSAEQPQRAVMVWRDITERKQAEETLRSLPGLILEAQEGERRRVARELHDSVNQILSSVKFRILSIEERVHKGHENVAGDVQKARDFLDRAMQEVRRISQNLRPSELDDLGLVPALRTLCSEFRERTGIRLDVSCERLPPRLKLPGEVELNLYRIIQEALTNIEKHSGASQGSVTITRKAGSLMAVIWDDGRGFDPDNVRGARPGRAGMGVVDMKERAAALGGTLLIESKQGSGSTLTVHIPLLPPTNTPKRSGETKSKEKDKAAPGG